MHQGLVVHHIPGRIRVRLPFLKGFSSSPEQIKDLMSPLPGIRKVDFNPITGSALISYDAEHYDSFQEKLAEYAQNFLGLTLTDSDLVRENNHRQNGVVESSQGESELTSFLVNSFKRLNAEVSEASDNKLDVKALFPVGIAAYALFKIGSAATTPLWVTLGLFSFASFLSLNPGALDESTKQRKNHRSKSMSQRVSKSS
jgi:hypothetical protein